MKCSSNESMKKKMNQQTDESMNQWTTKWVNQWSNESMNQRTNESRNQRTNESMNRGIEALVRLHLPKVLRSPQCFAILKRKSSYTLVHILPTWSSKSAPIPSVSYDFEAQIELDTVWCTFCWPHLRKCSETASFLTCSKANRALADIFPKSSPPTAETETLHRRLQEPHYPKKNTEFRARDRYTREFTRFRSVTLPNYLMMMGGWHDGVNANHDHRP